MSSLLVLYTGGTIGCEGEPLAPMSGDRFVKHLRAAGVLGDGHELRVLAQPLDSANMQPADWFGIADILLEAWEAFDGFVVLHGTDTLAWTASALSFLLRGADKPVVLTGSQHPPGASDSDAHSNIADALLVAACTEIHEVIVCFAGHMMRGNRCMKRSSSAEDAFSSPRWPVLGAVKQGKVFLDRAVLLPTPQEPLSGRLDATRVALRKMVGSLMTNRIWVVWLHPGVPTDILRAAVEASDAPRGIVLVCYGTGNAPERPDFLATLSLARERGIAVVAITQAEHGAVAMSSYRSGAGLAAVGVAGGCDLTLPAAHVKLQLALAAGLSREEALAVMQEVIAGEMMAPD